MMKTKTLLIGFLTGLVLIGIGSGIAFAEFSNVDYQGTKPLEVAVETTTDTHHFQFDSAERGIDIDTYFDRNQNGSGQQQVTVVADERLNSNEIEFEITHSVDTYANINQDEEYYEEALGEGEIRQIEKKQPRFYVNIYGNDLSVFKYFKSFVEDLKENKIYSYDNQYSGTVVVKVAPAMVDNVYLNGNR